MVFVIMVGIGQADESRNVIPRGGRQVRVDVPIGSGIAAGPFKRFVHISRTIIVRGDGQGPIPVYFVQVFQVGAGGPGGGNRIAPLIYHR